MPNVLVTGCVVPVQFSRDLYGNRPCITSPVDLLVGDGPGFCTQILKSRNIKRNRYDLLQSSVDLLQISLQNVKTICHWVMTAQPAVGNGVVKFNENPIPIVNCSDYGPILPNQFPVVFIRPTVRWRGGGTVEW